MPRRTAVFLALACLTMLCAGCWREWVAYDQQIRDTKTSLANLASSLARDAEATIDVADTMVAGIVVRLETDGTGPAALGLLNGMLPPRVAAMAHMNSIIVLDAAGNWLATSLANTGPNLSDRDSFRHGRDSLDRGPFIGRPVLGRMTGKWIITVSRRFQSADGSFAGVVFATIELSDFANHFAELDLGPKSMITLMTPSGILMARYPWDEASIGRDLSKATVFRKLAESSTGSYETTAVLDGVQRFSGYCQSATLPLIVVVSVSVDRVMGDWRVNATIHIATIAGAIGIVGLLYCRLARQMTHSEQAREALRKSEEFLDRTGRLAGVGGWELDLATNALTWSAETYRIHGVEPDYRPTVERALGFYAPEGRAAIASAVEHCKAGGEGWDLELPFNSADGRRLWVRAVGSATFVNGRPARITGAFEDVTDRVLERLALRTANERATLATDSGGIGVWDWDVTNNKMVWDAWMYRLYGMEPRDDVSAYDLWSRHLHPDDRESAEQAVRDGLEGTKLFDTEFRIVWDDGSVHHIHGTGRTTRDAVSGPVRMIGANWDVTNQRIEEAQRALIVEAAPNGMLIVDESGIITLANSQVERIFDYPRGALVGQPIEMLSPDEIRAAHGAWRSEFTSGRSDRGMAPERQFPGRKRDGTRVEIEIMLGSVKTPRGRIVVASLVDVTEKVRQAAARQEVEAYERQMAAATNASLGLASRHLATKRDQAEQASQAKTRFLAGMTHELRTPLHGILGYAELLSLEGDLNPKQLERLEVMMASGQHLLDMINAVLDMSRIEADELELHPVEIELLDLVRVCLDVVRPAADAKGLGLVLAPAARLRLFADPTRLRQVLINLLGNAVKFTPAGGVEVRLMQANDEASIRLEVADTGPGIRDRHVDKLFQTFERLNAEAVSGIEGAGLGLAIAARLVHAMGGEIGYTGNPGGGSVFWLELPGSCVVTAAIDGIAPPVLPAKPRMVVLVADDEALNRSIATGFLTMGGHEVVCVANGAEAVEAAANQDFDLILMDVRMPGMNGLEATRRIRMLPAPRGDVRIVAVTAQAFAQQIEICRRAGMNGHVSKPFKQAVLLAAVENVAEAPDGTSFTVVPSASASAGSELPVFDRTAFEDMTDSLSPADLGQHLRTLSARGEALSRGLREPDMLARLGELAEAAHLFAGGAGTLGFMSVAAAARRFEAAADANEGATLTLADELVAEIDLSMTALRREFGFPDETLSEANWGLTRAGGE